MGFALLTKGKRAGELITAHMLAGAAVGHQATELVSCGKAAGTYGQAAAAAAAYAVVAVPCEVAAISGAAAACGAAAVPCEVAAI